MPVFVLDMFLAAVAEKAGWFICHGRMMYRKGQGKLTWSSSTGMASTRLISVLTTSAHDRAFKVEYDRAETAM